jgi:hypothetical protein
MSVHGQISRMGSERCRTPFLLSTANRIDLIDSTRDLSDLLAFPIVVRCFRQFTCSVFPVGTQTVFRGVLYTVTRII